MDKKTVAKVSPKNVVNEVYIVLSKPKIGTAKKSKMYNSFSGFWIYQTNYTTYEPSTAKRT